MRLLLPDVSKCMLRSRQGNYASAGSAFDPPTRNVEPNVTCQDFEALLLRRVVVRRDITAGRGEDLCMQHVALAREGKPLTAYGIVNEMWHSASFRRSS